MSYRYPPVPPSQQTPAQKDTHAAMERVAQLFGECFIAKRDDGAMLGPFAPFIYAPADISAPLVSMAYHIINNKEFTLRERQLSVLATCSVFHAEFMTYAHILIGKDVGLTHQQTFDARHGKMPAGLTDLEEMAYDFSLQLANARGRMPDFLYEDALNKLGPEKITALIHNVGLYTYTSMLMNACATPVPDGGKIE